MKTTKNRLPLLVFSLFILVSIFALSACDNNHPANETSNESSTTCQHQWVEADCYYPKTCRLCGNIEGDALKHSWVDATCTSPKTCQLCGQIQGVAKGHDFSSQAIQSSYLYSEATTNSPAIYYYSCRFCLQKGTETFEYGAPLKELKDSWGYNYYIDNQFGEKTDEWFVTTMELIEGTFENSATENSPLLVKILYDCDDTISIFLYEYADTDNLVKNSSSEYKDYYKIVVKNEKGQTYEARGQMWGGGDRIYVIDTYHSSVLDLMKTSETLKFYIQFEDSPTTQYRFEVDMSNFNDIVNKMQQQ